MTDDTHRCPIKGCTRRVPDFQLMCRPHWRRVPYQMGRQLYAAWDNGRGAGTEHHAEMMARCVAAVEEQL